MMVRRLFLAYHASDTPNGSISYTQLFNSHQGYVLKFVLVSRMDRNLIRQQPKLRVFKSTVYEKVMFCYPLVASSLAMVLFAINRTTETSNSIVIIS